MENKPYTLVFDEVIIKQLKKLAKNHHLKEILSKLLDRIEEDGPNAGKLLDSKLSIYEIKLHSPPIRIYFTYKRLPQECYVFEYEMKTSEEKQQKIINKLRDKVHSLKS